MEYEDKGIEHTIRKMKSTLERSLYYKFDECDPGTLSRQAQALDMAFRTLVGRALGGAYEEVALYRAALRAQEQCRHTLATFKSLKKQKSDVEKPSQT